MYIVLKYLFMYLLTKKLEKYDRIKVRCDRSLTAAIGSPNQIKERNQSRRVVQKIKLKFSKKVRNLVRAAQKDLLPKKVLYLLLILWIGGF